MGWKHAPKLVFLVLCITAAAAQAVEPRTIQPQGKVRTFAWFPDSQRVAVLTREGGVNRVEVWSSRPPKQELVVMESGESFLALDVSPDGKSVACLKWRELFEDSAPHRRSEVHLFNTSTGDHIDALDGPPVNSVPLRVTSDLLRIKYSQDGKYLAAGGKLVSDGPVSGSHLGGDVCLWDLTDGELLWFARTTHTDTVRAVAFSANGTVLASAGNDQLIRLWNPSTGKLQRTLIGAGWGGSSSMALSPSGEYLATGGSPAGGRNRNEEGGVLRVWHVQSGRIVHESQQFLSETPMWVAFTPDKNRLFAVGLTRVKPDKPTWQLCSWNPADSSVTRYAARPGVAREIAVSPDGKWCAVGAGPDGIVLLPTE